jgi:hypothetical protein
MRYSGLNPGDKLDFFANYYPPTWSILYWLSHNRTLPTKRLQKGDVANAVTAQSMAMFIHSLDDHLTDNQLSVSPLTLLLRSQAWMFMNRAFCNLAEGLRGGKKTVRSFINEYYSSFQDSKRLKSLDSYCDLFRRQMAIGMVAPLLLSMKMTGISDFTRDLQMAFGSFGIAWRLLDDIKDIRRDIEKGAHSALYLCLPAKVRTHWNKRSSRNREAGKVAAKSILTYIMKHRIIHKIKERIGAELETAASIVESHYMKGFAREFQCLAHP